MFTVCSQDGSCSPVPVVVTKLLDLSMTNLPLPVGEGGGFTRGGGEYNKQDILNT